MKTVRVALASALILAGLMASPAAPVTINGPVMELSVTGVVDPFVASYIAKGIDEAESGSFSSVLVRIDTPGGLSSSMRDIVQSILGSRVPVICWVGPPGARAASAGAVILIGCPVAAMAPGTNVGAAHPVGVSGAIESQKAENDAAAYIRALAEERGRNADWAERAVRESISATAEEALDLHVIDFIAPTRHAVLSQFNGMTVEAGGSKVTAHADPARVVERELGLGASILHALLTPDLAFLFFFIGLVLLIVEFLHPGISVPGALGALMLIAAFASFGVLPVTLLGLALLATSAAAFLVDLKVPGAGVSTGIGLVALVMGGLLLFDSSVPNARVSYPVIAAVALVVAMFFIFAVQKVWEARKHPISTGTEAVVGSIGVAETALDPSGRVRVRGESWTADSANQEPIPAGTPVLIRAVNRLRLEVEPAAQPVHAEKGTEE